jgi:hypothetical protein
MAATTARDVPESRERARLLTSEGPVLTRASFPSRSGTNGDRGDLAGGAAYSL